MTLLASRDAPRLSLTIGVSALLHLAALAILASRPSTPPLPPLFEVNLVAAPAGPRSVRTPETAPEAAPEAAAPSPAPSSAPSSAASRSPKVPSAPPVRNRAVPATRAKPAPTKAIPKVAPVAPAPDAVRPAKSEPLPSRPDAAARTSAAPPAPATPTGGGPTGDKGTEVATVRTDGTAFPFPGYLQNIVRQIALNFRPRAAGALRCDVAFLIHRDGSVSNVRFLTRSGMYAFDLEAQGAIEAAARARAFGPLPTGFSDDVLPVTFSFDPRLVR